MFNNRSLAREGVMPDPDGVVMRTFYFPKDLDDALRSEAHRKGKAMGEIVQEKIELALKLTPPSEPSVAEEVHAK